MASGVIALTKTGNGNIEGQIVWSATANGTNANTSTVTASIQLKRPPNSWTMGTWRGTLTIGDTSISISLHAKVETTWYTIATNTVTVSHNDNGTGTCYIYGRLDGPGATSMSGTYVSGSSTVTLDTIPRQAKLTTASAFNDGNTFPKITYDNPLGNSASALQVGISLNESSSGVIEWHNVTKNQSSYSWTLSANEINNLCSSITTTNSRTVWVFLRTLVGSTYYYDNKSTTFVVVASKPTVNPTFRDSNSVTIALTNDNSKIVRYYSNVYVTTNASAQNGATVTSQKVVCGTTSLTGNGTINGVESDTFVFTVTDSRGISDIITKKVTNFVDYVKLTCIPDNTMPTLDGVLPIRVNGMYYRGSFGYKSNTLSVYYRYKVYGASWPSDASGGGWKKISAVTYGTNSYVATASETLTNFDYRTKYVVQCYAVDALATVYSAEKIVKSTPVFDWSENDFCFNVPVSLSMGMGVTPIRLTSSDDLNTIKSSGWYTWSNNDAPKNVPSGANTTYISCMRVWQNGNTCLQECVDSTDSGTKGCKIQRTIYGNTVYDWEWVNPPMQLGYEYRTTERHDRKAVYITRLNLGEHGDKTTISGQLPNSQSKIIDVTGILSSSTGQTVEMLPYIDTSGNVIAMLRKTGTVTVVSRCFGDCTGYSVLATVKYIKD